MDTKKKNLIIIASIILILAISAFLIFSNSKEARNAKIQGSWTYDGPKGPEYWGSLSESFRLCGEGKSQSPVNLVTANVIPATANAFQYKYQDTELAITNKGKTIQVNYNADSYVKIGPKNYKLLQFHFHSPSEFTVDGINYPMTLDLVHADADGNLAVINVFIKEGEENPVIAKLWDNIPKKQNKLVTLENIKINVLDLLPDDGSYYQMTGSLTTPPCSENVNWNLLTTPITLSKAQIDKFISVIGANARPVQPLNNRNVVLINTGEIVR